mgnify:FL=1
MIRYYRNMKEILLQQISDLDYSIQDKIMSYYKDNKRSVERKIWSLRDSTQMGWLSFVLDLVVKVERI